MFHEGAAAWGWLVRRTTVRKRPRLNLKSTLAESGIPPKKGEFDGGIERT